MPHILLVEDDRNFTWLVQTYLVRRGHRVDVAHSARGGYLLIQETRPEVAVLDILLPDGDGLDLCRRLRAQRGLSSLPILLLTALGDVESLLAGFRAGADDYLSKPVELAELEARIHALVDRRHPRPSAAGYRYQQAGDLCLDPLRQVVQIGTLSVSLTPVECELLGYLMSRPGQLLTSRRLLQEVWGYPPGTGNLALVRGYVSRLRRKIEERPDQPAYLRSRGRQGYTLEAKSP